MSYVNTSAMAAILGIDEEGEGHWYTELEHLFQKFDKDNSGSIDFQEMEDAITQSGVDLSREQAKKVFIRMDISGDGHLDIHEFFQNLETAWEREIPDLLPIPLFRQAIQKHLDKMENTLKKLERVTLTFKQLDEDRSGELSFEEWEKALKHLHCTSLSFEETETVFKRLDFQGDGEISIIEMMLEVAKFCLHYPDQLNLRDPEECFRQTMQILAEMAMGTFKEGERWKPRPRIKRKKAITVPEFAPGDISDDEFQDDGYPLTFVGSDDLKVEITKTEARLSTIFYDRMKDGSASRDNELMTDEVDGEHLKFVVKYLKRHQGKRPKCPEKPVTTRDMTKLVEDPWDAVFIDRFDKRGIYDFILACWHTGVKSGVLLGCCKLATLKPVLKSVGPPSSAEIDEWLGYDVDQTQKRNR